LDFNRKKSIHHCKEIFFYISSQLFVEKSEKKADALAQRARQFQEKGVLPPAPPSSMLPTKSVDEEIPPNDLLCPICKQVYTDAVITPCCHNSFCDECK
jgi:hypothetical protein